MNVSEAVTKLAELMRGADRHVRVPVRLLGAYRGLIGVGMAHEDAFESTLDHAVLAGVELEVAGEAPRKLTREELTSVLAQEIDEAAAR